jgi:hypothetical protein
MGNVLTTGKVNIASNVALASTASIVAKTVTGGVASVVEAPTAGGTGYTAGDLLTLAGGTGAVVQVAEIGALGVVTKLTTTPVNAGSGYVVGAGKTVTGGTGGDDCTVEVDAINPTTIPVTVHNVTCSPIANATGANCGYVSVMDGTVEKWRGYVFFTASATSQGHAQNFEIEVSFIPVTNLSVKYTAVTSASTASVAMVWS